MDAGLRLFSEKGYYNINSKDIAKEAGVAIGSFYAYFTDKKVLFIELFKEFSHLKFQAVYCCEHDELDPEELKYNTIQVHKSVIRNFVGQIITASNNYPAEFFVEIQHLSHRDEDIKKEYEKYCIEESGYLEEIFMNNPLDLTQRQCLHIATVIQKLIDSYVLIILKEKDSAVRESIIHTFKEAIFQAVEEQVEECIED